MIKKAVKRPDEVEYIEFKGRENFEEVCEFTGRNLNYVVNSFGVEYIAYGGQINIKPGYIFYRDVNEDKPEFQVATKDEFFKRYKDEITTKEFANIISESRSKMTAYNGGE